MKHCALFCAAALLIVGCSSSSNDIPSEGGTISMSDSFGITADNVDELLPKVFEIINAVELQQFYDQLPLRSLVDAGETNAVDGFSFNRFEIDTDTFSDVFYYDCAEGGMAKVVAGPAIQNPTYDMELEQCGFNGDVYQGHYFYSESRSGVSGRFEPSLMIITDGVTVNAVTGRRFRSNSEALPNGTIGWEISEYVSSGLTLDNFESEAKYNDSAADLAGFPEKEFLVNADVAAEWTLGETIKIRTTNTFSGFGPGKNYQNGIFMVTADDGSLLSVNAGNGDPNTFQVDVVTESSTTSLTISWQGEYKLPCLAQPSNELGCRVTP